MFSAADVHKLLGSSIINYIGLYLALFAVCDVADEMHASHPQVHGAPKIRCNLASFFMLAAIALNVIGIIILWNLQDVTHKVIHYS